MAACRKKQSRSAVTAPLTRGKLHDWAFTTPADGESLKGLCLSTLSGHLLCFLGPIGLLRPLFGTLMRVIMMHSHSPRLQRLDPGMKGLEYCLALL